MAKEVQVTIAGKQYQIKELTIKRNKAWREKLGEHFADLAAVLSRAPAMELDSSEGLLQVAVLVRLVAGRIVNSMDLMLELVFDYSPELKADQEYIEENGHPTEIIDIFVEVIRLAFPFGNLLDLGMKAVEKAGRQAQATSKN